MSIVKFNLGMNAVYLEIGGNQGNRLLNIKKAIHLISEELGEVYKQSSVYETPPWGFQSEQNFFNQILLVSTSLSATEVLAKTLQIEKSLGRVRAKEQYSSRTMDIDILFFNNEIINTKELIVPHPRLHLRRFVLEPMFELNKDFKHPILNKTMEELLNECEDNSQCTKVN